MKVVCMFFLLIPLLASADDISEYQYYINSGAYVAYVKKNTHCIYGGYIKENDIHEYCKMGESGLSLKSDHPSVYATEFFLAGATIQFIVAAPWAEQKCEIYLPKNRLTCEPTGK